ncbi:MAG TPA: hypothetical protein VJA94_09260 [Candidatus Angelobacter sp.]
MTETKKHQAFVVPGSVKSSAVGGVQFVVRCCGRHEKSVHIQHPGKHTQEELLRIRDQHLADVAQEHANHEAAVEFLAQHEQSAHGTPGSSTLNTQPAAKATAKP